MERPIEPPINLDEHVPFTLDKYGAVVLTDRKAVAPPSANSQNVQPPIAAQQIAVADDPALAEKMEKARVLTSNNPNDAYEFGTANRNSKLLANEAFKLKGTVAGGVFESAANRLNESDKLIADVGGIDLSSPKGRTDYIKVVDTLSDRDKAREAGYGTIADNPKLGTALVQFLLGDKLGAVASITGGNVKTYTEFNDKGQMRVVKRNDLGEIDSVFDDVGRLIKYEQYRKEGGSRPLEHTIAYKIRVLNAEKNATAFATTIGNYNSANGVMNTIGERAKIQEALYPMLKSLTPKQQEILASFTQGTIGTTTSAARLKNKFDQGGYNAGDKIEAEDARILGGGVNGPLTFDGKNTWTDAVGKTYNSNTLKNTLDQMTNSSNIDKQFTQTRANLAEQMAKYGLDQKGINALDTYFDLEQQNQKDIAKFTNIIPGVIQLPTNELKAGDQPTRLLLNSLAAQKGARQMSELLDYTNKNYANERSNDSTFTPEPGRYEGAFVNTESNKKLNAEFNARALGLISKPAPQVEKELPLEKAGIASIPPADLKKQLVDPYTSPTESPTDAQKRLDAARQAVTNKAIQQQKDKAASRAIQESLNRFKGK
jgi:hypothetical protein